jgi:alanine racemase
MALVLTVDLTRWRAAVDAAAGERPGLVPVVKGNGYGLGRSRLVAEVRRLGCTEVAVGTVHEIDAGLAGDPSLRCTVLTPALAGELPPDLDAVLTVGRVRHVDELQRAGWHGAVVVKLGSSMRRYGAAPDELAGLVDAARRAGLNVHGYGLHLPLDPTAATARREIEAWLPRVPPGTTVYVSHVPAATYRELAAAHPEFAWRTRVGTDLWLARRDTLRLWADVVDVRPVRAGNHAGYRGAVVAVDGHLVMVTAGTAHGVNPLEGGRSPFHFARRRLALVEPPHMHTSMVVVPQGDPCPDVGERVDVQRPLTQTWVDRIDEE